ncbi:hypothetical protein [Sediminibacterium sp.]|jgi:hypothetical protein|uniref:hypothetical protein n=1 Tax=Sediminibacterium sp. TaxID=1917865 RepID=UPI0025E7A6A6|nr:hypothetical protein [Sediminibacterium sp.]MBT9483093.1 hypothetical protein [Sediminibacterium sp.]
MALGIHTYYVFPRTHNLVQNKQDYMIGSFVGDHFNDEIFAEQLKRIEAKLKTKFGFRFTTYWSPGIIKTYKTLSQSQRFQRAITKASNLHKKKALQIIQDNTLFTNDFLYEEIKRYHDRVEMLKKRYNQIKSAI